MSYSEMTSYLHGTSFLRTTKHKLSQLWYFTQQDGTVTANHREWHDAILVIAISG